MPNLKIFVEQAIWADKAESLIATPKQIREVLCGDFGATPEMCHIMIVPAFGLEDQSGVYVDMNFRPTPARTPDCIAATCKRIDRLLRDAGAPSVRLRATAQDTNHTHAVG